MNSLNERYQYSENHIVVGIGELKSTHDPNQILRIFGIGSCVAICFYAPIIGLSTIAHVALPDSSEGNHSKKNGFPAYYADDAIHALFKLYTSYGFTKPSNIKIKLVGGANVMDTSNYFQIGRRNIVQIKKILWKRGFGAIAEDLGGSFSRTVSMYPESGEIIVSRGKNIIKTL